MSVYYSDDMVTLHHGDCVEVMRSLPEASVDAVVTDPPYGLEFMGKEWDRLGNIGQASHQGFTDGSGFKGFRLPTGYNASANVKCERCSKWKFDHVGRKCECGPDAVWPNIKAYQGREMQEWHAAWATETLRILKPGGHLLAFGGTRTWHRLAVAIEDAGFEIRDSCAWLYGSGFPKSLDVSKAIDKGEGHWRGKAGAIVSGNSSMSAANYERTPKGDAITPAAQQWQGWGTALKPAFEPIVVARKPLDGTVAENVLRHGTGALNIDGSRIGMSDADRAHVDGRTWVGRNQYKDGKEIYNDYATDGTDQQMQTHPAGRWPANVILDESQAAELDRQSGVQRDGVAVNRNRTPETERRGEIGMIVSRVGQPDMTYGGEGGASRFFYVPKANASERPRDGETAHPTVKPLDLMRYLVKLVTPPGGTVLEPFAGSGTTLEACVIEGFHVIGIELTEDYLPLIVQRVSKPIEQVLW